MVACDELAAAEEAVRCLEDRLRDSDLRKRELTKDVADRNEKLDRAARALAEREATWRQRFEEQKEELDQALRNTQNPDDGRAGSSLSTGHLSSAAASTLRG